MNSVLIPPPSALGDCGPDEGFLGKQLFTIGAHSCRCEFLSAIRGSFALGAGAGAGTGAGVGTLPQDRKLSIATDPTLSNPDSHQWQQRLRAISYARKNVGYSLGSDVHDLLVLLPALWEGGVEGQFEMEIYCNLPFCLSRWVCYVFCSLCSVLFGLIPSPCHRIDPSEINAPVLTTRQKSIMAREATAKAAEEKEKLKRIAEHRRESNQVRRGLSRMFEWPSRDFSGVRRILGPRLSSSSLLFYERLFPY